MAKKIGYKPRMAISTQKTPILAAIKPNDVDSPDELLFGFLQYVEEAGLSLYPAQEEAILALMSGEHVILNTPTGSGKSLVATALAWKSLVRGERFFYTAPIKALVSEKFFAMCELFGAENVALLTGDASVNRDAPIVCCTAEILSNFALGDGKDLRCHAAALDEYHFYGDKERGVAWQIPTLILPQTQFLLMSATLGNADFFREELEKNSPRTARLVKSEDRPVPLHFEYRETPLHETLSELIEQKRAPVYLVHFTQRSASEFAQDLMSIEVASKEQKQKIKDELSQFRWDSPYGKDLKRFVLHGVGVHHAGLLPKYRLMVEKLAQKGLLTVISGTDTLGVGVNVPIRSVLFTKLCKYDGKRTSVLSVRDFKQIAGRAGRKGFDHEGFVVAQAPEHMVENRTIQRKAEGDAKKMKKMVLKKPPEKGYAHFDEQTFKRLIEGEPERLESQFQLTHGALLTLYNGSYQRAENGCKNLRSLIERSHESRARKFAHGKQAIAVTRSLLAAGLLEGGVDDHGKYLRVPGEFQEDLGVNQPLSLFAIEIIQSLDMESESYALDVVSVIEAIVEDPDAILFKQLDKRKEEKIRELKAEGMPFEERMEELEKVDIDRPLAELLDGKFREFQARHPWVSNKDLRPKSIARDMFEKSSSFGSYVRDYGLERSEGLLLRHLSEIYGALRVNVPEDNKSQLLHEIIDWFRVVIASVDSSLIDEWELLREGKDQAQDAKLEAKEDPHALELLVHNLLFRLTQLIARKDYDKAASVLREHGLGRVGETFEEDLKAYFEEHEIIRVDAETRSKRYGKIERTKETLFAERSLLDAENVTAYRLRMGVNLLQTEERGEPMVSSLELIRADQA